MRTALPYLALGLVACAHKTPEPVGPPLSESEKAEAERLLAIAEVDGAKLPGGDHRRALVRLAGQQKCPCPEVEGTLAECADRKGECIRAPFAVRAMVRALARDEKETAITERLLERFGPREPEEVDIREAPCRGPSDAPVTMVVFSDFECPFCALGVKLTEEVQRAAGDRLRVCFKNWPLTHLHKQALLAARAAVAAQLQGKFWAMHDRLFAHRKELRREDLVDHAEAVGLDVERFKRDLDSDAVARRVKADVAEADRLQLTGTPTFIIDGRRMTDPKTVPDFLDWIAEAIALGRAGAASQPALPRTAPGG
jgi:hypothetical protein